MRNVLVIVAASFLVLSCNQNDAQSTTVENNSASSAPVVANDSASFTSIEWIDSVQQDLGTIAEGQTPEISWRFKNTGSKPLVIENTSATCGCTVAEKPEQPIMPGEEGTIKAKFTSEGRPGPNNKQVIVSANTQERQHALGFTVIVEKK